MIRMLNDVADSIGLPSLITEEYRRERAKGFVTIASNAGTHGILIETAVMNLLTQLSGAKQL